MCPPASASPRFRRRENPRSPFQERDAAIVPAKDCGRNNLQFFKTEMNRYAVDRHSLESDLHLALERQEFVLHYQPKVELQTGQSPGSRRCCAGARNTASS